MEERGCKLARLPSPPGPPVTSLALGGARAPGGRGRRRRDRDGPRSPEGDHGLAVPPAWMDWQWRMGAPVATHQSRLGLARCVVSPWGPPVRDTSVPPVRAQRAAGATHQTPPPDAAVPPVEAPPPREVIRPRAAQTPTPTTPQAPSAWACNRSASTQRPGVRRGGGWRRGSLFGGHSPALSAEGRPPEASPVPARPPAAGRTTPAHLRAGAASTAPDGICAGGGRICDGERPPSRGRSAVKTLCCGSSGLPALPHPSDPYPPALSLLSRSIARRCADAPDGAASNSKSRLADGVGCLKRGLTLAPAGADGVRARQWRMPPGQVCGGGCHLRSIHLHECTNKDTLAWFSFE